MARKSNMCGKLINTPLPDKYRQMLEMYQGEDFRTYGDVDSIFNWSQPIWGLELHNEEYTKGMTATVKCDYYRTGARYKTSHTARTMKLAIDVCLEDMHEWFLEQDDIYEEQRREKMDKEDGWDIGEAEKPLNDYRQAL